MPNPAPSLQDRILKRFRREGPGVVLSPRDLLDLGSGPAVRQALSRAVEAGLMRKVARGLYQVPRRDPEFGTLAPTIDAVIEALQKRDGIRLLPSGAHAANILGLSTQVPVRVVFLTDGPTRRIRLGRREIVLKRTTPRQMATAGKISGTVIQALRWMGAQHMGDSEIAQLRERLSKADKKVLLADQRQAPAWVASLLRRIALGDGQ